MIAGSSRSIGSNRAVNMTTVLVIIMLLFSMIAAIVEVFTEPGPGNNPDPVIVFWTCVDVECWHCIILLGFRHARESAVFLHSHLPVFAIAHHAVLLLMRDTKARLMI